VVVGSIGADLEMDYTAIGHTVGLAQRAEQLAEPGKVCLTEHTAALVEGYLELVDLGEVEPKGAGGALRTYELAGRGEATGRVEALRRRGLSHFVGREAEMDVLEGAREQALAGQGQVVGIVGGGGVWERAAFATSSPSAAGSAACPPTTSPPRPTQKPCR
jgi:hypothetical protein